MKIRRSLSRLKDPINITAAKSKLHFLNKKFTKSVKNEKSKYYRNLCKVNNLDEFWKIWSQSRIANPVHIPIFKENKHLTIENNFDILVETLFINRITNRLEELKFFNDCQYGFVKGRSIRFDIFSLKKNLMSFNLCN